MFRVCFVCVPGVYDSLRSSHRTWARIMLTLFVSLSLSNALSLSFSVSKMMKCRQVDNIMRAIEFCIVVVFGLLSVSSLSLALCHTLSEQWSNGPVELNWRQKHTHRLSVVISLQCITIKCQKTHRSICVNAKHGSHALKMLLYDIIVQSVFGQSFVKCENHIFSQSPSAERSDQWEHKSYEWRWQEFIRFEWFTFQTENCSVIIHLHTHLLPSLIGGLRILNHLFFTLHSCSTFFYCCCCCCCSVLVELLAKATVWLRSLFVSIWPCWASLLKDNKFFGSFDLLGRFNFLVIWSHVPKIFHRQKPYRPVFNII